MLILERRSNWDGEEDDGLGRLLETWACSSPSWNLVRSSMCYYSRFVSADRIPQL